jgi:hypothetical protein
MYLVRVDNGNAVIVSSGDLLRQWSQCIPGELVRHVGGGSVTAASLKRRESR